MTIFEISFLFTPLTGAIAGYMAVRSSGIIASALAIGAGLAIGIILWAIVIGLMCMIMSGAEKVKKFGVLKKLLESAGTITMLTLIVLPFVSFKIAHFVVGGLLRL
ncbi:hypothetical protein JXA32_17890 [Candidatus Sumerlaeota bacterium]|nr:hypothetical protein [Candidatus Sumerlaeota bacterium]